MRKPPASLPRDDVTGMLVSKVPVTRASFTYQAMLEERECFSPHGQTFPIAKPVSAACHFMKC